MKRAFAKLTALALRAPERSSVKGRKMGLSNPFLKPLREHFTAPGSELSHAFGRAELLKETR